MGGSRLGRPVEPDPDHAGSGPGHPARWHLLADASFAPTTAIQGTTGTGPPRPRQPDPRNRQASP